MVIFFPNNFIPPPYQLIPICFGDFRTQCQNVLISTRYRHSNFNVISNRMISLEFVETSLVFSCNFCWNQWCHCKVQHNRYSMALPHGLPPRRRTKLSVCFLFLKSLPKCTETSLWGINFAKYVIFISIFCCFDYFEKHVKLYFFKSFFKNILGDLIHFFEPFS